MSYEDKLFLTKMEKGVYKQEKGHYEIPLPLKNEKAKLEQYRSSSFQIK